IYPINRFGSEEQKDKWLPGLVSGDKVGCFGLTEPDYGSDPAGMKTTAVKDGHEYVLNGSKMWITNSDIADYVLIWAYLDGVARAFVVEAGTPGMLLQPIHHKFSMRASDTGEIHLNDCRIPEDHMLPGAEGMTAAYSCLNQARYSIAWGVLGAAIACYNEALEYSKTRIMFDKPIGSFQLVQEKLADMLTDITAGQLLCLQLGRLMEKDQHDYTQISLAKRNNVRVALDVARKARDILGASGISVEYQTMRHMLNLESVFTYEGTDSIHTLILGKKVTGLDAVS
ncbi:MAG: acyl-CoA dehydrogenase family protein, partial [Nitrospinota bacterium]|nr:acyl-CoA dehydrogenase family protein [Nitrospinota bacterium]